MKLAGNFQYIDFIDFNLDAHSKFAVQSTTFHNKSRKSHASFYKALLAYIANNVNLSLGYVKLRSLVCQHEMLY
jgi:gamma-glutamylcysteine synthetase